MTIVQKSQPKVDIESSNLEFNLAQSRIKYNYMFGVDEEFRGEFLSLVSGVELDQESSSFKFMGRLEYYSEDKPTNDLYASKFTLDEAFYNKKISSGQITLGKQLFSWGVFDEFSNFDRVNLKNLNRFVFDSGEAYRRSITALRMENYLGNWKFDSFIDFGIEEGIFPSENSLWSGVDRENGRLRGADSELISSDLVKNVSSHFSKRNKPSYGLRSSYSGDGDISFTYLRAYTDSPTLSISDTLRAQFLTNTIDLNGLNEGIDIKFYQEDVFGVDMASTLFGQLYKFEISYIPNSKALNEELLLEDYPKLRASVGGDFEIDSLNSTLTWQYIHEEFLTSDEFLFDSKLSQALLQFSKLTKQDLLRFGLRSILNLNDNSYYLSPFFDYEITDSDTIGASYYYFTGEDNSFFGYHRNHNFLSFNYKKLF